MVFQKEIILNPRKRGFHLITKNIIEKIKSDKVEIINEKQAITPNGEDADIFSVEKINNYAGICIINVRDGKIRGTKTHLIKDAYFETINKIFRLIKLIKDYQ